MANGTSIEAEFKRKTATRYGEMPNPPLESQDSDDNSGGQYSPCGGLVDPGDIAFRGRYLSGDLPLLVRGGLCGLAPTGMSGRILAV